MPVKPTTVSLIISTYNWPEALELCLKSVALQSYLPCEIIIADDGSKAETQELIQRYKSILPVEVKHVWHEDTGFKLAEIRNKAIWVSKGDYIVQVDGDLILHPHFIKDHVALATPNRFIAGSRLLLTEEFSRKILEDREIPVRATMLLNGNNRLNALRIPILTSLLASSYKMQQPYYVKGCNMSFWRSDLIAVDGYEAAIKGWGKEDSEIAVRLINKGVKRLFIKFGGVCYHIYHAVADRSMEKDNDVILMETIESKKVQSEQGISSCLGSGITIY
jgi:glycosyltransferase involved in cell wall biosynthesis